MVNEMQASGGHLEKLAQYNNTLNSDTISTIACQGYQKLYECTGKIPYIYCFCALISSFEVNLGFNSIIVYFALFQN